jgi:2-iminobutanoate/2-iminopropanoate deaminase
VANVERALRAAGAELSDVVSVIVYLADIDDWGRFNEAYKTLMPQPYPTRTALGANLRGILVEMSAVAFVGSGG